MRGCKKTDNLGCGVSGDFVRQAPQKKNYQTRFGVLRVFISRSFGFQNTSLRFCRFLYFTIPILNVPNVDIVMIFIHKRSQLSLVEIAAYILRF